VTSLATFATAASSAAFVSAAYLVAVAASSAATASTALLVAAAAVASLLATVDPLLPDPLDIVDTVALGSGCDAVATSGACCPDSRGPPTADPLLRISFLFLY
jgi:hypothetical protein